MVGKFWNLHTLLKGLSWCMPITRLGWHWKLLIWIEVFGSLNKCSWSSDCLEFGWCKTSRFWTNLKNCNIRNFWFIYFCVLWIWKRCPLTLPNIVLLCYGKKFSLLVSSEAFLVLVLFDLTWFFFNISQLYFLNILLVLFNLDTIRLQFRINCWAEKNLY